MIATTNKSQGVRSFQELDSGFTTVLEERRDLGVQFMGYGESEPAAKAAGHEKRQFSIHPVEIEGATVASATAINRAAQEIVERVKRDPQYVGFEISTNTSHFLAPVFRGSPLRR